MKSGGLRGEIHLTNSVSFVLIRKMQYEFT